MAAEIPAVYSSKVAYLRERFPEFPRCNLKDVLETLDPYAVYVGRQSPAFAPITDDQGVTRRARYPAKASQWGNPYPVGSIKMTADAKRGDRWTLEDSLEAYSAWLDRELIMNPQFLQGLRGKNLYCWCRAPSDPPARHVGTDRQSGVVCHADILLARTKALYGPEALLSNDEDAEEGIWYCATDGACKGNPGPGGVGAFFLELPDGRRDVSFSRGYEATTNNIMEIKALTKALNMARKEIPAGDTLYIYTDSQYVLKGLVGYKGQAPWCTSWIKKGWKTAKNKPVKNEEHWKALIKAHRRVVKSGILLHLDYVKAHTFSAIPRGMSRTDPLYLNFYADAAADSACPV